MEAALASVGPAPALASVAALRAGMVRKSTYTGVSMGSKYRTDELYRLIEATPGSVYELQARKGDAEWRRLVV